MRYGYTDLGEFLAEEVAEDVDVQPERVVRDGVGELRGRLVEALAAEDQLGFVGGGELGGYPEIGEVVLHTCARTRQHGGNTGAIGQVFVQDRMMPFWVHGARIHHDVLGRAVAGRPSDR